MRSVAMGLLCAALVLSAVPAVAASAMVGNPAKAVEGMLLIQVLGEAELDSYTMSEMIQGYQDYRAALDALEEQRDALAVEIQADIDAGENGYELRQKVSDLMDVDRNILDAKQTAVGEAGSVVDAATQAKLYLIASDIDAAIEEVGAALSGAAPCPMAAPCPATAGDAAAAASPEEMIMTGVEEFTGMLAGGDIAGAMEAVDPEFSHYEYGDREGLQMFLEQAKEMGYLDGLEISLEDAEVEVEGEKATVYPVDIEGNFGSATLEFTLGAKDGTWVMTGLDVYGI